MHSLADAIIQEDISAVTQMLRYSHEINLLDEYGFTPLIEAAIANNIEITKLLLQHRALPNLQDVTGGTALQWAVENNNLALCKLLLDNGANPNSYNFAGQPVLVMPMLRQQSEMRQLLIQSGADQTFALDYINTKLLGHIFELIGTATIVSPDNQYVEVDFEGFYLEVTLGLIADSLTKFQHHFAARQLRRYSGISSFIVEVLMRASQLIKLQQYRIDITKYTEMIDALIKKEPLVIPVGYEGHAITFIRYGTLWVKCDRREDSRLYDNVMVYQMSHPEILTTDFIKNLIYKKQSNQFINKELDALLGLQPITEIRVDAQISGNCSWANVEAIIPALFFLVMMEISKDDQSQAYHKTLALNYFHRWREWNKERLLDFCAQSYDEGDAIRKACKAEIMAAILFQRCRFDNPSDNERIEFILSKLLETPYSYLLTNYLRVYHYEGRTEQGKQFADMLKAFGFKV
jgi:hypothetical protein